MKLAVMSMTGLALAIGVRAAAAECGARHSMITPPPEQVLPIDPIVFVFEPGWGAHAQLEARQGGRLVALDEVQVGESQAWHVYRVAFHGTREGELVVHYASDYASEDDGGRATYRLAHAAPPDHAELLAAQTIDYSWPCSYSRGVSLATRGNAIAYRVEWREPSGRGDIATAYLPALDLWTGDEIRFEGGRNVFVGHLSCNGHDVPDGAFAEPTPVELVALFADGREAAIPIGMVQIDGEGHRLRAPEDFASPAILAPPPPPAAAPPPPRADAPPSRWPAIALVTAATAIFAASILRPRRRRRRAAIGQLAD